MPTAVCFNGYFRIFLRKIRCWMECFIIFVMAWCWFNATESKPQNVKCNIFSELTQKASLLFFRKKINENCNRKILRDNGKLKPNFVLKILFGKILCEIKNWNQTLRDKSSLRDIWNRKPNFVDKRCVEFFSSWKYNTAFNSGLKIWRVSGKSEMARLFNLKFFLYLCWFGFGSSPHFQAAKR